MNNFREVNDDILRDWLSFREEKYVKSQLDRLDKNFMDYICYWNEKYYRNGFCDGIELMIGSLDI